MPKMMYNGMEYSGNVTVIENAGGEVSKRFLDLEVLETINFSGNNITIQGTRYQNIVFIYGVVRTVVNGGNYQSAIKVKTGFTCVNSLFSSLRTGATNYDGDSNGEISISGDLLSFWGLEKGRAYNFNLMYITRDPIPSD